MVSEEPPIILDAGHNAAGAAHFVMTARDIVKNVPIVLSLMRDKDHHSIIKTLSEMGREIIITKAPVERVADPHSLGKIASKFFDNVTVEPSVQRALTHTENGGIVIGSIFLLEHAFRYFEMEKTLEYI